MALKTERRGQITEAFRWNFLQLLNDYMSDKEEESSSERGAGGWEGRRLIVTSFQQRGPKV